jgi:septum formation protein
VTLVLASRSPQRAEILRRLGVEFITRPSDVAEIEQGEPTVVARENALRKARGVAAGPGELVLGVDTIVALDGVIYGKPANAQAAAATLRALSGRTHVVISGVALVRGGEAEPRVSSAQTAVTFRALDGALIDWYLAAEEWRERSGGYAMQQRGAALIAGIEGDYTNVVGLPVAALLELLPQLLSSGARTP